MKTDSNEFNLKISHLLVAVLFFLFGAGSVYFIFLEPYKILSLPEINSSEGLFGFKQWKYKDHVNHEENWVHHLPFKDRFAFKGKKPLVTMIEFLSYACPYSKELEKSMSELRSQFASEIQFEIRFLPDLRNRYAVLAAKAAIASGFQGKFWDMHTLLMDQKGELSQSQILELAKGLKMNQERFELDLDSHLVEKILIEDMKLAQQFALPGTPSTFMNGRLLTGVFQTESLIALFNLAKEYALDFLKSDSSIQIKNLYNALIRYGRLIPLDPSAQEALNNERVKEQKPIQVNFNENEDPYLGDVKSSIKIFYFVDFLCPYCLQMSHILKKVWKKYHQKILLVYKGLPVDQLHPLASMAAEAALAAHQQGLFWEYFDQLFLYQSKLTPELFQELAQKINLNIPQWNKDRKQEALKSKVKNDFQWAKDHQFSGTPSFVINKRRYSGLMSEQELEGILFDLE